MRPSFSFKFQALRFFSPISLFAVKVIECNLRASRSFPFISKTFDFNFISLATKVMAGMPARAGTFSPVDLDFVGLKSAQFSFSRLQGADPTLGVEMMSTGEVACFGHDQYEAFLLSIMAAGFKIPKARRNVLISVGSSGKPALLETCGRLVRSGYTLYATPGTHAFFQKEGLSSILLEKPNSGKSPNVIDYIRERKLDLVINDAESGERELVTDGFLIRRTAIDFSVPLLTNVKCAILFALAIERVKTFHIRSMEEYYSSSNLL